MEFNQKVSGFRPLRQPGDLLIAYDMGGGSSPDIHIRIFIVKPGQNNYDFKAPDVDVSGTLLISASGVNATINTETIASGPWLSWQKKGITLTNSIGPFLFAEAIVDLSTLFGLQRICFGYATVGLLLFVVVVVFGLYCFCCRLWCC